MKKFVEATKNSVFLKSFSLDIMIKTKPQQITYILNIDEEEKQKKNYRKRVTFTFEDFFLSIDKVKLRQF